MTVRKAHIVSESINNVILPKFHKYFEDRQNDISLNEEIEKEIAKIEKIVDFVNDIPVDELPEDVLENGVNFSIADLSFRYDSETESMKLHWYTPEELAKNIVLNRHNLGNSWRKEELLRERILAIVSMLDDGNFDDILKVVETNLDFNEFIKA